ncbi:hypothetical protein [Phage toucan80]|nr:hypothetical protein [Phage toucan80]
MIDPHDTQTQDLLPVKRGRGRPKTATPEKKRADNAERQRRFRDRQRVKAVIVDMLAKSYSEDASYELKGMRQTLPELLAYVSGMASDRKVDVTYVNQAGGFISTCLPFSRIVELIAEGVELTELA